ncbi:MAG: type I restriction enzyme HsdR N-terminal domain-containing protein [Bacteroidales bacterium]|nr:type I restriction enzyme HsdR N-terminal domain-containing protein [Bacteroidales bacterium]
MLLDPLRKKYVPDTPEERVRQWFISVLAETARVPAGLMQSEVGFTYGQKRYRADVVIYDRAAKALAVVECKRPEVALDASVAEQATRVAAKVTSRRTAVTYSLTSPKRLRSLLPPRSSVPAATMVWV